MIEPAKRELDGFVALLQSLGIVVRRPEAVEHRKRFSTPQWSSRGFCNSCPRDSLLVIGDEIMETPSQNNTLGFLRIGTSLLTALLVHHQHVHVEPFPA
jgi:hypothetical protein